MPKSNGNPAPLLRLHSKLPAAATGQTLLDYLAARFRYLDRQAWSDEIRAGRVLVNDQPALPHQRLRQGNGLTYLKATAEPVVDHNFRILHQTADFAIVDKPAHLPMHADGPFVRHTLVHLLRSGPLPAASLVHRLDRETSGVCVVALQATARRSLEAQFAAGTVTKHYLAVVHGEVAADFVADEAIGTAAESCIALRRSAAATAIAAKPARTSFRVLARGAGRSLLLCRPYTGRTHQIRVHLEHHGHALLGDKLYGHTDDAYLAFVQRVKAGGDARTTAPGIPAHQLLHALRIAFQNPADGQEVRYQAALPASWAAWLPPLPEGLDLHSLPDLGSATMLPCMPTGHALGHVPPASSQPGLH